MKSRNWFFLWSMTSAFIAFFSLSGCGASLSVDPTVIKADSLIGKDAPILKEVRPSIDLLSSENVVKDMGLMYRVQAGRVFRELFQGGEESNMVLDLVNSSMTMKTSDYMVLGTKLQITYSVSVVLRGTDGQKSQVFSSTANGTDGWSWQPAMREAIELAVIDLASQVEVYLEGQSL